MSQAQPVLGYPSKSAAAYALKKDGKKHMEIAAALGVNPTSVGNLIRLGRYANGDRDGTYYTDALKAAQRHRLRVEAAKRGMTVRQLVTALLTVVTDDKLFAALLDDGGDN